MLDPDDDGAPERRQFNPSAPDVQDNPAAAPRIERSNGPATGEAIDAQPVVRQRGGVKALLRRVDISDGLAKSPKCRHRSFSRLLLTVTHLMPAVRKTRAAIHESRAGEALTPYPNR